MIDNEIANTFKIIDEILGRYKSLKKDLIEETLKRHGANVDIKDFIKEQHDNIKTN